MKIYHLVSSHKTSLLSKFPCFLHLPPTNLEWSVSLFGLSLPKVYGGGVQITPGKFPKRLQANTETKGEVCLSGIADVIVL